MTLPIPSNVFADGQLVDEAGLFANVLTPINIIYAAQLPKPAVAGIENAIAGTTPSISGSTFQIQAGTHTVTTSGGAIGTFNWPIAFPNGVLAVCLTSLTDLAPQVRIVGGGGTTASQCQFVSRLSTGGPNASASVTVSYIAFGW